MKKLLLILFATILLSLNFTSCDDEFGVKDLSGQIFIKIEKAEKIETIVFSDKFKVEKDMKNVDFQSDKYISIAKTERYSSSKFMKNWIQNDCVFYATNGEMPETRQNYENNMVFKIQGKEFYETFYVSVNIPYLEGGKYLYKEYNYLSEKLGEIQILFGYKFSRSF